MKGAHCLTCLENGPDLVLSEVDPRLARPGVEAALVFTCGTCGARWRWLVTWSRAGLAVYGSPVQVLDTQPGRTH